jgi:hypothetical protein
MIGRMEISYDHDLTPTISEATKRIGDAIGRYPIYVICEEPGAKFGDQTGVTFITLAASTPAVGERIRLQDKRMVEVQCVYHTVCEVVDKSTGDTTTMLLPNVLAFLIDE